MTFSNATRLLLRELAALEFWTASSETRKAWKQGIDGSVTMVFNVSLDAFQIWGARSFKSSGATVFKVICFSSPWRLVVRETLGKKIGLLNCEFLKIHLTNERFQQEEKRLQRPKKMCCFVLVWIFSCLFLFFLSLDWQFRQVFQSYNKYLKTVFQFLLRNRVFLGANR